jgi:signal transduction histidine kinase
MFERKSLKWPILLAIVMIVLLVVLTVGWILITVFGANWVLLSVGSVMFGFVLMGVVLYLIWSIQQINLNRRQSNFIDAVTHELKSPIASLKLFLQTLGRHHIDESQRQEFYRSMLDDVDRLDRLITQLLDVARLQEDSNEPEQESWISIDHTVNHIAGQLLAQHRMDTACLTIQCPPCEIWARRVDLEILIRNLLDNAIKYAGKPPEVGVYVTPDATSANVLIAVTDNGIGIPRHLRRTIFRRFYRIGNELERTKPGTGLGLFLVRSIVRRLKGSIQVVDMTKNNGSRFELRLPQCRVRNGDSVSHPNGPHTES